LLTGGNKKEEEEEARLDMYVPEVSIIGFNPSPEKNQGIASLIPLCSDIHVEHNIDR